MNTIRSLIPALALVAITGCAMETTPTGEKTGKALSMSQNTPERISGELRRDGLALYFESARFEGKSIVSLRTPDGTELLPGSEGGDKTAKDVPVDDVATHPELALLDELPGALTEAGASEELVAPLADAVCVVHPSAGCDP